VAALGLATYAAWITELLLAPRATARVRRRIWGLFSFAFFAQLIIGLLGVERFLMNGVLHLPVPAIIPGGPIFRGDGLFMLILFGATLLLVGPAWCSYLCYIGAWDSAMAQRMRRPVKMPRWRQPLRLAITLAVIGTALLLNLLGAPAAVAAGLAAGFGLLGVGVMLFWSRRTGVMTHCVTYCPTGLLAAWFGRISPFRMRINTSCDDCMACTVACRYDALNPEDVHRRRPGSSCTLCGDCLGRCRRSFMEYRFLGLSSGAARGLFLTLVAALHAVFLGVAML
jgi:polyferredoxin